MSELLAGSLIVACTVVSTFLTGAVRRYALALSILDVPNERSSHAVPTPLGGGAVIVLCYAVVVVGLGVAGAVPWRMAMALFGAVFIGLVGWRDDREGVPALPRLVAHFATAGWAVAWLGGLHNVGIGRATLQLGWLGDVVGVLMLAWLTNLYNFMDGVDGLAGSEAVVVGGAMGAMLWAGGQPLLALVPLAIAASALGFLVWNWQPARIFMGDVGSGMLGFAFGTVALCGKRAMTTPGAMLLLLLPLGVFIGDATFTLFRRLLRGERIYVAHRSHVYQQLVQAGWSHSRVTVATVALDLVLVALAWVGLQRPATLPVLLVLAALLLACSGYLLLWLGRRAASLEFATSIADPAVYGGEP